MQALRRAAPYLGFSASILTIIFAFDRFYGSVSHDARFGMSLLAAFAVFFLVFAVAQEYRFSRKARYAEAMIYVHQTYRLCLQGTSESFSTEKEIANIATQICDQLSQAFGLITGARCSVCVKVLDQMPDYSDGEDPRISVSTLCRDTASIRRQVKTADIIHWLEKNTDFFEIFETIDRPHGGTYFNGNLTKLHDYNNTSFESYSKPKNVPIPLLRGVVRSLFWPLPYKSTVGAAIYPLDAAQNDSLAGFLFVDCASRSVFSRRYDIDLMRYISAALHPMMMKWSVIVSQKKEGNDGEKTNVRL